MKCLLAVVGGAGTIMVTIILRFTSITINSQQEFMKAALDNQMKQITQIVKAHSSSIHSGSVPIQLWDREIPRLTDGIAMNREANEVISHEVLSQWEVIRTTQRDIEDMKHYVHKISKKLGVK